MNFFCYQGMLEAARRKTRSSLFAKPSIWTNSSVFIRRLPSCSLRNLEKKKQDSIECFWSTFTIAIVSFLTFLLQSIHGYS